VTITSPTTSSLDAVKKHVGLRFISSQDKGTRFPELPPKACKGGIMTGRSLHRHDNSSALLVIRESRKTKWHLWVFGENILLEKKRQRASKP
jgi:hypothetical protein